MNTQTLSPPETNESEKIRSHSSLVDWVILARPTHWLKNSFVFAPLLFTESAQTLVNFARESATFVAFCFLASAVYAFNDLLDASADRTHPRKRHRPVASGRIGATQVLVFSTTLALLGLAIAGQLRTLTLMFTGLYLANSLLYCLLLKYRVLVDVLSIAIGFMLRLLAGCSAIGVEPSSWLIVCGFSVALFLGFGKRRAELAVLAQSGQLYRGVLSIYTIPKLDTVLAITCAVSLLSYMLYAISPETIARHGTKNLVYTTVFVMYGLFRYLFKVQEGKGDGPTEILTKDPVFLVNAILWGLTVYGILRLS